MPKQQLNLSNKGMLQMKMLDAGVDPKTALMLTNRKDKISDVAVYKLKEKYKRYSLTRPKTVKLAERAVLDVLEGKEIEYTAQKVTKTGEVVDYKEKIVPSASNKLAAAAMVYDRYEPVKQQDQQVTSNTYIDLTTYQIGSINTGKVEGSQALPCRDAEIVEDKLPDNCADNIQAITSTNDIKHIGD